MKQNHPVNQRERPVPPGEMLVSKTDLRGVITYANTTFAEVSGYALDELVGQSHNLVRHPDVPPQVFADLWKTLEKGLPWRGIVKNRAKNGDHYWVESFVMPTMVDGKITGYQSVRRRASREDIEAAEKHYREIDSGKPLSHPGHLRLEKCLSIRSGITLGIVYVAAMLLVGAMVGLGIMRQAESELSSMYENKVRAGDALARIKFLMADNRAQVMLGLLHDPANPLSATHDHPISRHTGAITQSRNEIDRLWDSFRKRGIGGETAKLADGYWTARMNYVKDGLEPVVLALDAGEFREANQLLGARINRLYEQANTQADELMRHLLRDAEASYVKELERHALIQRMVLVGMIVALTILAAGGFLFFRGIMVPLDKGIANLLKIAQGDLSGSVNIEGGGEIGRFNRALAMTQAQLRVMIEEIANGVTRVSSECGMLNTTVLRTSNGIDEQHERIYQVADRLAESTQVMSKLSQQAEEVFHSAERSVHMVQTASKEFSELLVRMLIVADAVIIFREQLGGVGGILESFLAPEKGYGGVMPASLDKVRTVVAEIRKVEASLTELARKIEQDKPWEMAHGSAQHKVAELGGELAMMARELATEARIQSFASEDAQREMGKVAMFLVEGREAMHVLWHASSNLSDLAASLENTAGGFNLE